MTVKITKKQEMALENARVRITKIDFSSIPESLSETMRTTVLDRVQKMCKDGVDSISFLPHKSKVLNDVFMNFNDGVVKESMIGTAVSSTGAEISGECNRNGRVTAMVKFEGKSGRAIIDVDVRKARKTPMITVLWHDPDATSDPAIPGRQFHDAIVEFGIDAPTPHQNCVITAFDERSDPDNPVHDAKCYGKRA